ncbi:DUF4350 domain-containing protein [Microbacterium sp. W1N]|uniref:DUF4350 domain-containing protein n=1 Tax=Microbacterium festucae TaxID=2977531 RepID=UPI0021C11C34|nr:DUF4350 domain-containing protein [Microbacterium festucae]MCT9818732.1 DUF4350 domain-containing protein [Microbacterium festucae]
MTTTAAPVAASPSATAPRRTRAIGAWVAIVAGFLVVGAVLAAIAGVSTLPAQGRLDPEAAGPAGGRALAQILADQGIDVVVARDRAAAVDALAAGTATLAITDTAALSDETLTDLVDAAADAVVLEPRSRDLRLLWGAEPAGAGFDAVAPQCALPEAGRAGELTPGFLFTPGDDSGVTACYPDGDAAGLLVSDDDGHRLVAVDGSALFTNESLAVGGNAALGIGLLGHHPRLVWYVPTFADSDVAAAPTLGELTPAWVTPAMLLLVCAAVAAAIWRGRRFGPLVAENLPVTVRAGETTEGRARLYAAAGDPTHAADELRIASLRRAARTLGLGPGTPAHAISDAVAAALGADRAVVRGILVDRTVADDRALVEIADSLRELDLRLTRTTRPERNTR